MAPFYCIWLQDVCTNNLHLCINSLHSPCLCLLCLQVVEEFAAAMGAGLDEELGRTLNHLDGRLQDVCANLHTCINSVHWPCLCFCAFRL
jgi:hypothetical protein